MYREHGKTLVRYLVRLGIRPVEEARDVMHEVFVLASRLLDRLDPQAPIQPWLFGLARNVARNALRSARRTVRRRNALALSESTSWQEQHVPRAETLAFLLSFLRRMNPKDRSAVLLHHLAGLHSHEIAAQLKVPTTTIYSSLRRAKTQLSTLERRSSRSSVSRRWRCTPSPQ